MTIQWWAIVRDKLIGGTMLGKIPIAGCKLMMLWCCA